MNNRSKLNCPPKVGQKSQSYMGRKKKYSYSERLSCVLNVLDNHCSLSSEVRRLGTVHSVVRFWVALYKEYGSDGLRLKNSSYSERFKLSVINDMYNNYLSLFETAVKFKIPDPSTVRRWERLYEQDSDGCLIRKKKMKKQLKSKNIKNSKYCDHTREELLEEILRLNIENDYLKKVRALVQERIAREDANGQSPSEN